MEDSQKKHTKTPLPIKNISVYPADRELVQALGAVSKKEHRDIIAQAIVLYCEDYPEAHRLAQDLIRQWASISPIGKANNLVSA